MFIITLIMRKNEIQLLQFFICENFSPEKQDGYKIEGARSNIYVPKFPHPLSDLKIVTCWKKDQKFHKEVIEYQVEDGQVFKSAPMDIEPMKDEIFFRWHTHRFPPDLIIKKSCVLWIRVVLDWKTQFESYLLIEKRGEPIKSM